MAYTKANKKLTKKLPNDCFISIPVICSILGQILV